MAKLLDVPYGTLIYHVYRMPPAQRYRTFEIQKASGGTRTIVAPATALKILQSKLNQVFQAVYSPRACVHGFVRNRNVRTNADAHCGQRWILNLDLEAFFPSISFPRVRGLLMAKPYELPERVATILAQMCCFEGCLPQGAPTSPVVANMICAKMDTQLMRLAQNNRSIYTRYADDITFSTSRRNFSRSIAVEVSMGQPQLGSDLRKVLEENWFAVNERKTRLSNAYGRQEVTGLTMNRFPNVQRKYVRQVRSMLHAWKRYGYDQAEAHFHQRYDKKHRAPGGELPSFRSVVKGKLHYLAMVKSRADGVYAGLVKKARKVEKTFNQMPIAEDALWVIECTPADILQATSIYQGTGFFLKGFGLISCQHVLSNDSQIFRSDSSDNRYRVEQFCASPVHDLAVLKTDAECIYELSSGDPEQLREGDAVFVLGFPAWSPGQTVHVTPATVTGFKQLNGVRRIALSARIVRGNSGGPVVNAAGLVIGVAVTGSDDDHPSVENGVIPIDLVRTLIDRKNAQLSLDEDVDIRT